MTHPIVFMAINPWRRRAAHQTIAQEPRLGTMAALPQGGVNMTFAPQQTRCTCEKILKLQGKLRALATI
jgi:hypothetical protein